VGIRRLLHSSCCFLNTNTAITRHLIWTARTLEAEWRQVCGEAWVREKRKTSQVLGAFRLLCFTMLRCVLDWRAFWSLWTAYFFNFPIFFSGCSKLRITETKGTESADKVVRLYFLNVLRYVMSRPFDRSSALEDLMCVLFRFKFLKIRPLGCEFDTIIFFN